MSKDEFLNNLTQEQKEYINFLIDTAYVNGYDNGFMDGRQ